MVELSVGAGPKARRGEIDMKSRSAVMHAARHQRGVEFFSMLLADIVGAADALTKEDNKKHPCLFVDITAWGGDSSEAHSA